MSLQEAIQSVQDAAKAQANGDAAAHQRLLDGIHKLRLVAESPAEKAMRMRFQMIENLCVRLAIEYGVLQAIAAKGGNNVSAADIAKETGTDELLIVRMMRLVTHVGMADETGHCQYASNQCTAFITTEGSIGGEKHHTDLTFGVGSKLIEMKRTHGLHQFPEGHQKSPFHYAFGMPIFEYLQHDQEQKEAFDVYMPARRSADAKQWFDIYPAEKEFSNAGEDDVLVVDVGGGVGQEIINLRKKYPDLKGRLILQELSETFKGMETKPTGIELMEHDFFTEQPIKGARVYYLRTILHDWSDEKCKAILSEIVKAMDANSSRILINDYVLPDTAVGQRAAGMDMLMFLFASGIERTKRQWEALLGSVGLEIVKIWTSYSSLEPVIEVKIRESE